MKILIFILVAFLPLHALLVTTLKCKIGVDTDIFRFWKEIILAILFLVTFFQTMKKYRWDFSKLYKNNYVLGMTTTFVIFSFLFIFLPFLQPKASSFLGFKYDVFFLVAFVIGLYLNIVKENFEKILKILFLTTGLVLAIFTPWYLFGDIQLMTDIFGFSSKPSTSIVNGCVSYSQNVKVSEVFSANRFQGSFAGPIRWSVFLTTFYLIFLGFILNLKSPIIPFSLGTPGGYKGDKQIKLSTEGFNPLNYNILLFIVSIFVITAVFFSYSKTTILGLIIGLLIFSYLVFKIKFGKKISKKALIIAGVLGSIPISAIIFIKRDLFLHLGSVINRFDNLMTSIEMFLYNPFGYGLGIAGPASSLGKSIESAGDWTIAVASSSYTHKFLPENWFVQILLEQGLIGLVIFISLILIIWYKLFDIVKKKKDYLSIGILTSYTTFLIMANLTHAFEESATSYILFLIIGAYIALNGKIKK